MGNAATRSPERVAASMGQLGTAAAVEFTPAVDVPQAGVLLALPALLAMGLLKHTAKLYQLPAGYYGIESIFLVLAFMALARIPSLEQLRYQAPGEWGNLMGLDRIPEVRCLRNKLKLLCATDGTAAAWNTALAKEWMEAAPEDHKGLFYADGHVRVYHGDQTELPRHYVSRQRLCLRATTDYWLNAMDGQPIFYVNKESDPGLLEVLKKDLVPWMEANVARPEAPSDPQAEPPLWFTIVCDREVYSPDFFREMNQSGIAVMTYHKFPGAEWPVEEFQSLAVPLAGGETTAMDLAERTTTLSNGLEVREVRKRTESGKQVAIISTNRILPRERLAAAMFARWSQENFYKYMRQHYALDSLASYDVAPVPETVLVINPVWRKLDAGVRALAAKRQRLGAEYSSVVLKQPLGNKVALFETRKAGLQEQIEDVVKQLDDLKQQRKSASRRVPISQLPMDQRFLRLAPERKHFLDTVKMICYRAETAMACILRPVLARSDDARSLLRQIYTTEADLIPDYQALTLTVQLHHLTQQAHDKAVRELCAELNLTETLFPGTNLRLVYKIGSA